MVMVGETKERKRNSGSFAIPRAFHKGSNIWREKLGKKVRRFASDTPWNDKFLNVLRKSITWRSEFKMDLRVLVSSTTMFLTLSDLASLQLSSLHIYLVCIIIFSDPYFNQFVAT